MKKPIVDKPLNYSQDKEENWENRLYNFYVSSGQAREVSIDKKQNLFKEQAGRIKSIIKKHIPKNKNIEILDLACGHGDFIYFLEKFGYYNIKGIDISKEQVSLAQELGIKNIFQGNIRDYLANSTENIDCVLLIDILEHLEKQELFDILDLVYLRLKKGGKVIIHVPNGEGIFSTRVIFGDLTHKTAFTSKSMKTLLNTVGFKEIKFFEEAPVINKPINILQFLYWKTFTIPIRLLMMAESGRKRCILSQNLFVTALK